MPSSALPSGVRAARLTTWLRAGDRGMIVLALGIGLGGGLGAVLFRELIFGITRLATGREDYGALGRVPSTTLPALGPYFLLIVPVLGGLVYGPLLARFAPEARGHGVPEVMLAVARQGGRIRPRVAFVKALASAACIGTGGSVGREGPIVQIGGALGSTLGQAVRLPERQLRLLVACGAAAGISATFNTPIAGVFFAMEVILREIKASAFGYLVVASVAADVVGRAAFGAAPFLTLPTVAVSSVIDYGLFGVLGVLSALVGVGFLKTLYGIEDLADRVWRGPAWARPVVGGVVLGALLLALPELYGVGYPVLSSVVGGNRTLLLVLVLIVGKVLATSTSIAIGGSGGVFAPSLFIGAMLGSAYGRIGTMVFGGLIATSSAYGVVGMGAVFASAARAPMTAVLILFELTGDPGVILPAMLAVAIATALADRMTKDTIYTLKLRRRGIDIDARDPRPALVGRTVGAALRDGPEPVDWDLSADALGDVFATTGSSVLAVRDETGSVAGVVTLGDVEQDLASIDDEGVDADSEVEVVAVTALSLIHALEPIRVGDPLQRVLDALVDARVNAVPVVNDDGDTVRGWLTSADVLVTLRGGAPRSPAGPVPGPARPPVEPVS